jgi:hypothetical protein
MLSVIMLNVVMLSVVMLNAIALVGDGEPSRVNVIKLLWSANYKCL